MSEGERPWNQAAALPGNSEITDERTLAANIRAHESDVEELRAVVGGAVRLVSSFIVISIL